MSARVVCLIFLALLGACGRSPSEDKSGVEVPLTRDGPVLELPSAPNPIKDAEKIAQINKWPEAVVNRFLSVARVRVSIDALVENQNYSGRGSGTLIAPDTLLTVLHLFPPYEDLVLSKNLDIEVVIAGNVVQGFIPSAKYYEPASDLAVVKLKERLRVPPIPLAKKDPKIGDTLYTFGFTFVSRPIGLDMVFKGDAWEGNRFLIVYPAYEHGYSGAPMLNKKGELVGINRQLTPKGRFGKVIPLEYINDLFKKIRS